MQNLLNQALTVIPKQTVQVERFDGLTTTASGLQKPNYDLPYDVEGSFQPVPRNLYENMGLDFQKNYANFYTSEDMGDVSEGRSGARVTFSGGVYMALSKTPWHKINGWNAYLLVEVR